MLYRLGYYCPNGSLKCLYSTNDKKGAKREYDRLKEEYRCTIWVQKIEFVNPKEEFK